MLVSTSFTNANLTPTRHLKIGLSRKKNIKVHSPKKSILFLCVIDENRKFQKTLLLKSPSFIRKIILFDNYCRYKNVSCRNFFSSYKFSADKTMKHFITFKFLFDLYLIKPQTSELLLPRNYAM